MHDIHFVEKAIVALIMTYGIMTGNIDLSVASVMAFSSSVMGVAMQAGPRLDLVQYRAAGRKRLRALLNGLVITKFNLPAMIVTARHLPSIGGLAYVILGDQAVSGLSNSSSYRLRGYIPGTPIHFPCSSLSCCLNYCGNYPAQNTVGADDPCDGTEFQSSCVASGLPVWQK